MRWILLIVTISVICGGLLLAQGQHSRPRPRTYREAVIAALDRRGIPYRAVDEVEICRPTATPCIEWLYRYGFMAGNVRFVSEAGEAVMGRISCRYYGADCSLAVPGLGLRELPMPNIVGMRSRPTALEIRFMYARILLRRWVNMLDLPGASAHSLTYFG
jgi:hypothetical protein